ncbi:kinase-like domain-containing protein [Halteromyces radiatus]|uniref:kinase-like domain-containing protein n=1 Tax=Halteromyces radiatus TaxID=101107 RepID=UPI00221E8A17|nr:kinase-like domain-containing protein [Halteromyces radiatus]KAI8081718.1 kinase-like domain-containing protein [Halteromyces radiatus]
MDSDSDYSDCHSIYSDEEEGLEDYKTGGYHKVSLGDTLQQGRYKIQLKLGWGHFSTVWLAYDTKLKCHVAVKIVKSSRRFTQGAKEEIALLEKIQSTNPTSAGYQHIAQLLDHFEHEGDNGIHVCMVFEVLGESLLSLIKRFKYRGVPAPVVKKVATQVLLGLDYLHRECGIIHTDLKPENVLVYVPNVETVLQERFHIQGDTIINGNQEMEQDITILDQVDTTGLTKNQKKKLKKRIKKKLKRQQQGSPRKDKNGIITSSVLDFTAGDLDVNVYENIIVKIADLGNACWTKDECTHLIQTREYRSPEVILGARWNEKTDLWSFACMIFELLTGEFLFDPRPSSKYSKDDDHIAQMIELMGNNLPTRLTQDSEFSHEFFDRHGNMKHIKKLRYRDLHDVLEETYRDGHQLELLTDFLTPMLQLDDDNRAGAAIIMNHKWLHE